MDNPTDPGFSTMDKALFWNDLLVGANPPFTTGAGESFFTTDSSISPGYSEPNNSSYANRIRTGAGSRDAHSSKQTSIGESDNQTNTGSLFKDKNKPLANSGKTSIRMPVRVGGSNGTSSTGTGGNNVTDKSNKPLNPVNHGDYEFLNRISFDDTIRLPQYAGQDLQNVIAAPSGSTYKVFDYITGQTGSKYGFDLATYISPSGSNPVAVFVGTGSMLDVLTDADPRGIGYNQIDANKDLITNALLALNRVASASGRRADLTGYSLGGASAQNACILMNNVKEGKIPVEFDNIVTFNSPGINEEQAKKYNYNAHCITHYVVAGDIVSLAGDDFLPGDYRLVKWDTPKSPGLKGLTSYPLDIVLDKHDTAAANKYYLTSTSSSPLREGVTISGPMSSKDLSSGLFSYLTTGGEDWASLNLALTTISLPLIGASALVPAALLQSRATAEGSRTVLGGLLKEFFQFYTENNGSISQALGDILTNTAEVTIRTPERLLDTLASASRDTWNTISGGLRDAAGSIGARNVWDILSTPVDISLIAGTYGAEGVAALVRGVALSLAELDAAAIQTAGAIINAGYEAVAGILTLDDKRFVNAFKNGYDEILAACNKGGAKAWEVLKTGGEDMWKFFEAGGTEIFDALAKGGDAVLDIVDKATAAVGKTLDWIGDAVAPALDYIDSMGKKALKSVYNGTVNIGDKIADFFGW